MPDTETTTTTTPPGPAAVDPKLREKATQYHDRAAFTVQGLDDESSDLIVVGGYAARYDRPFLIADFEMFGGGRYQMFRKNEVGMFARSLTQNPNVALRLNHGGAFARSQAGTLRLTETDQGLLFEADLSRENSQAVDMAVEMARGTLVEASVAYYVQKDRWERQEDEDGNIVETQFTIEGDLNYGDVSVVLYGANPDASSWLQSQTERFIQALVPSPAAAEAVVQAIRARYPARPAAARPSSVAAPAAADDTGPLSEDTPAGRLQAAGLDRPAEDLAEAAVQAAAEAAADPDNGLTPHDREGLLQLMHTSANL